MDISLLGKNVIVSQPLIVKLSDQLTIIPYDAFALIKRLPGHVSHLLNVRCPVYLNFRGPDLTLCTH